LRFVLKEFLNENAIRAAEEKGLFRLIQFEELVPKKILFSSSLAG
jgi:hypothetical protein